MGIQDHFSRQSADYAAYRPTYPAALYAWLASQARRTGLAWDAGCGNGQATLGLAEHFAHVEASDPSDSQIAQATPHPNVHYHVAAESLPALADHTVDLITVAQALHWFDQAAFAAEVRRVAAPGALVAAWTYNLHRVTPGVDAIIDAFYAGLDPWWQAERRHVEDGYAHLSLPGRALEAPAFAMTADWSLEHVLGYLASWSAVARCAAETGRDPVGEVRAELEAAWGGLRLRRRVVWPLAVIVARV